MKKKKTKRRAAWYKMQVVSACNWFACERFAWMLTYYMALRAQPLLIRFNTFSTSEFPVYGVFWLRALLQMHNSNAAEYFWPRKNPFHRMRIVLICNSGVSSGTVIMKNQRSMMLFFSFFSRRWFRCYNFFWPLSIKIFLPSHLAMQHDEMIWRKGQNSPSILGRNGFCSHSFSAWTLTLHINIHFGRHAHFAERERKKASRQWKWILSVADTKYKREYFSDICIIGGKTE